jgi:hypothetical protein
VAIATAPEDWWEGYDSILGVTKTLGEVLPGLRVEDIETKAFCEGSVGWASSRIIVKVGDVEIPTRVTGVFHLENGGWKFVQLHQSYGVPE